MPAVAAATALPLVTSIYSDSEACAFLVQAAWYTGAHVLQNEEVEKRDSHTGRHAVPGGKGGDGGRGYKDDGDDDDDDGGDGQTQQSNIKPTSMVRTVVVTTARAMTKAARATVAGATRTTMATTTATAAAMTPNGDKHNNQILSRHQR